MAIINQAKNRTYKKIELTIKYMKIYFKIKDPMVYLYAISKS